MTLTVTCFYCGARKQLESGTLVKLTCDLCNSPKVVLAGSAVFRCTLCGRRFELPAGREVKAYHDESDCRGRALILLDYK
ncbi:MAG: hypothetical protein AB1641_23820 [Thermodesulfobacteriota bacterium]